MMMPKTMHPDTLLTLAQVAQVTGYQYGTLESMTSPSDAEHYDPELYRLRIKTDRTFRAAFGVRAQYVYRLGDVNRWFEARQSRPTVRQYNASRGITIE